MIWRDGEKDLAEDIIDLLVSPHATEQFPNRVRSVAGASYFRLCKAYDSCYKKGLLAGPMHVVMSQHFAATINDLYVKEGIDSVESTYWPE